MRRSEALKQVGAKQVTVTKMHKNHVKYGEQWEDGKKVLIAIRYGLSGEEDVKEVQSDLDLRNLRQGPLAYDLFEVSKRQNEELSLLWSEQEKQSRPIKVAHVPHKSAGERGVPRRTW